MDWLRNHIPPRLWTILLAPLEVIGCTVVMACRGFRMGVENVREAWREQTSR